MAKIKIDLDELAFAMDDHSNMHYHVLDLKTGQIFMVSHDEGLMEEFDEDFFEQMEDNPGRFPVIEPVDSKYGLGMMQDFIAQVKDERNRDTLERAIEYRKPFANFRQALYDMGNLRNKWYEFKMAETKKLARQWLEMQDFEYELVSQQPDGEETAEDHSQ